MSVLEDVIGSARFQCLRHDRRIVVHGEDKDVGLPGTRLDMANKPKSRETAACKREIDNGDVRMMAKKELIGSFKIAGAKDRPDSVILQDALTASQGNGMIVDDEN